MEKTSGSDKASAEHIDDAAETPQEKTLQQSIRLYPRIVWYSIGLTSSFLLAGYDAVIVGTITAVPRFQADFGERFGEKYIIPSVWMSLWSAMAYVGTMIGGAVGGPWQDRSGRRWPLAVGSAVSAVSIAILYVANLPDDIDSRRGLFLAGKIVQGFSTGILMAATQTYISETVPTSLRGSAMALFPTFMLLGQIIGAVVIYASSSDPTPKSYLTSFASQWPFSAVPFVMAIIVPESPSHLARKENHAAALRSLQRLHTPKINTTKLLEQLRTSIRLERELSKEITYKSCLVKTNRRRTLIVAFASTIPALFGLPLLSNASYYMQVVGMKPSLSLIFLILGIGLGLIANGIGIWAASRIGRRPLTLISLSITVILWIGMGIAGCWSGTVTIWSVPHPTLPQTQLTSKPRYTAITMMVIIIVCGMGCWPASYAVAGETSALSLRAKTQGIGVLFHNLFNIIFNLILPYIYNPDSGDLRAKTGFVYAGFCFVGLAGSWVLIPEMKGRSVVDLDRMFELKLPAREFSRWTEVKGGGE